MTRLPDWLIVGAPKAGTTTLARWLREHPAVFVSAEKEVDFFGTHWDRGVDWYADHFTDAAPAQAAGEATPLYLYLDVALDRLAATVPDARLVVVLREPAARAWSHAWFFRLMGIDRRPPRRILETELADPSATIPGPWDFGYLDVSRYVTRLDALAGRFPREQVHVLFSEEMRTDPDAAYAGVLDHLGAAPRPAPRTHDANEGTVPRSFWLQRFLRRGGERTPRAVRDLVLRMNVRPAGYPPLPDELRDRLREEFAEPNERLADWLGRPLPSSWC